MRIYFKGILLIFIVSVLYTCSPRQVRLEYSYDGASPDSALQLLKRDMIALEGISLFSLVPDSSVLIVEYDRFRCSQNAVEKVLKSDVRLKLKLVRKESVSSGA